MKHTVKDAIKDLVLAFNDNKFIDPLNNPEYFNIKNATYKFILVREKKKFIKIFYYSISR